MDNPEQNFVTKRRLSNPIQSNRFIRNGSQVAK